jgi:transposase
VPVPQDRDGSPASHDTTVDNVFARWSHDSSLAPAFIASGGPLSDHNPLDLGVLHGAGTTTVAQTGGAGMGYSGDKHQQGEPVIAMTDNNGDGLSPLPVAPASEAELIRRPDGLRARKRVAPMTGLGLEGSYGNLDGGFDSKHHRNAIFNAGMMPNITEHPRHRKTTTRGRKRCFNGAIHARRDRVERTCAWEDKFKRWLLRFERIQQRHYSMQWMAYTRINLRRFCGT